MTHNRTRILTRTLLASFILLFPAAASAWKYIDTEHFRVIYENPLRSEAAQVARIAEKHYPAMTREQNWKPFGRTKIIVTDKFDIANGYSTPMPDNIIMMYIMPPDPNSSIGMQDIWLEDLFLHEYTHSLNLDRRGAFWQVMQFLFGRTLAFPNAVLPMWHLEGNAIMTESQTGRGRLNSTYARMVMRTDLLYGSDKDIVEAAYAPDAWPEGDVPYLYGAYFQKYLNTRYPERGNFTRQFTFNSRHAIPFRSGAMFRKQYSRSIYDEWEQWKKDERARFAEDEKRIQAAGTTELIRLTPPRRASGSPRFIDNDYLIFIDDDPADGKAIAKTRAMMRKKVQLTRLERVTYPSALAADKGEVYWTDLEMFGNYNLFYDIHGMDAGRITTKKRVTGMDVRNGRMSLITFERSQFTLSIAPADNPEAAVTVLGPTSKHLAHCRLSPDGARIAFTFRTLDGGGRSSVGFIDLKSGTVTAVATGDFSAMLPAWKGNAALVFSCDKGGVYNLWESDLAGNARRITNLVTGALESDVSPDGGKIVFTEYGGKGQSLALLQGELKSFDTAAFQSKNVTAIFTAAAAEPEQAPEEHTYLSLLHIKPWAWLYTGSFGAEGKVSDTSSDNKHLSLSFLATDPLQKQSIQLSSVNDFSADMSALTAYWSYNADWFILSLGGTHSRLFWGRDEFPYENDPKDTLRRKTERSVQAGLSIPIVKVRRQLQLSAFGETGKRYTDTYQNGMTTSSEARTGEVTTEASFSNTEFFKNSVIDEKGIKLLSRGIFNRERLGDETDITTSWSYGALHLPMLFDNHALVLSGKYGWSDAETYGDYPFQLGESPVLANTGYAHTEYGIRGYRDDEVFGNRFAAFTAEYSLPLISADFPLYFHTLYHRSTFIRPFFDICRINGDTETEGTYRSAGAELFMKFSMFYLTDISFKVGYVYGLDQGGESAVTFGLIIPTF